MTASIDSLTRLGKGTWQVNYSSGESSPVFRVYLNGNLFSTTTQTSIVLPVTPGTSPIVDVIDQTEDPPTTTYYPKRATLNWKNVTSAVKYRVQQYIGSTWTTKADIADDGRGFYQWKSGELADGETHQFRVIALDSGGRSETATTLTLDMVRIPDAPDVTFTYDDSTQKVTINDA